MSAFGLLSRCGPRMELWTIRASYRGMNMDRVLIVGFCWFALWIALAAFTGSYFHATGSGAIAGFFVGLVTLLAWPLILPERINQWMDRSLIQ